MEGSPVGTYLIRLSSRESCLALSKVISLLSFPYPYSLSQYYKMARGKVTHQRIFKPKGQEYMVSVDGVTKKYETLGKLLKENKTALGLEQASTRRCPFSFIFDTVGN